MMPALNGLLLSVGSSLAAVALGSQVRLPFERKEISVTRVCWRTMWVPIRWPAGANMAITIEGGQLMSQVANQPKVLLFAEYQTKFFTKVVMGSQGL